MQRGYILNIFDSLNFDIGFIDDIGIEGATSVEFQYSISNELGVDTDILTGKSYRCHIKDLRFRPNARFHHDFRISKNILIQWSDYSDGNVMCKIHNVDTYNRLIVEVFDPFTLENYKTYLVNNFPTIFSMYQYASSTVKLSELKIGRNIPRPLSFQLPEHAY